MGERKDVQVTAKFLTVSFRFFVWEKKKEGENSGKRRGERERRKREGRQGGGREGETEEGRRREEQTERKGEDERGKGPCESEAP